MKSEMKDKYSVAWFKLAECISRREKERALGVYRLLSHSFENQAVKCQLEGDIFLAFDDCKQAIDRYEKAAQAYLERQEFSQAAAMYEHLFFISGEHAYVDMVLKLHKECKHPEQIVRYLYHACRLMLQNKNTVAAQQVCDRFRENAPEYLTFMTELTYRAIADPMIAEDVKLHTIHTVIKSIGVDAQYLGIFLAKIKAIDIHFYRQACIYLESLFGA